MLRNTGKGTFVDVTQEARVAGTGAYGMGVAVGDYDNDGFLDLDLDDVTTTVLGDDVMIEGYVHRAD